MNEIIKQDILSVLSGAIEILKIKDEGDILELGQLSNRTIHNASIFQDDSSISIAILMYSLAKVIARKQNEIDYTLFLVLLANLKKSLSEDNMDEYNKTIKKFFNSISQIDSKMGMYVSEVIDQAQVKKAGKIHEHGISLARTAEILGISEWELMGYIGKTTISDTDENISSTNKRLKFARGLFT